MPEAEQDKKITAAYEKLRTHLPSIGFINRKKRIKAYIQITQIATYMIENNEISEDEALFIFSLLMRKCSNFQKAAMMTALTLDDIKENILSPIGLDFTLNVRKNLNLPNTHHSKKVTKPSTPEHNN